MKRDGLWMRLNVAARADIEWWHQFGLGLNGTSLMRAVVVEGEQQEEMLSDTSKNCGCRATQKGRWFQIQWNEMPGTGEWSIMLIKLLPIVVAAVVWGKQ